jgi:hypothetical protein
MIVAKYERVIWEISTELNTTERGAGGYGMGIKKSRLGGILILSKKSWLHSFFLDPCAFSASCSEVEQFSLTHLTGFVQNDRVDIWRGYRESSFYTNTIRNLSNGESSSGTLALAFDYIAFEALDPFFASFNDLIVDSYIVTSLELWKILDLGQLLVYECDCLVHNFKLGQQK